MYATIGSNWKTSGGGSPVTAIITNWRSSLNMENTDDEEKEEQEDKILY